MSDHTAKTKTADAGFNKVEKFVVDAARKFKFKWETPSVGYMGKHRIFDNGHFYLDTEHHSPYSDEWSKLERFLEKHGFQVFEGDDGMMVEPDWDNVKVARHTQQNSRKDLIRLASILPTGSVERKTLLATLKEADLRKDKKLAKAIEKYLREIQDESQRLMDGDPTWGRGGKYDPVADAGVWVGDEAKRKSDSGASVVFHFDGAGYDHFSTSGDYAYMGDRKYRQYVQRLAERMGYHVEDINNWSMGFYPEY